MIRLTRRYRWPASHRLHSDALSEEQNWKLYGKCNNPYGHGHDYVLEVSVTGEVDARTGQVARRETLDALVESSVLNDFAHKNLNQDVPDFADPGADHREHCIRYRAPAASPLDRGLF